MMWIDRTAEVLGGMSRQKVERMVGEMLGRRHLGDLPTDHVSSRQFCHASATLLQRHGADRDPLLYHWLRRLSRTDRASDVRLLAHIAGVTTISGWEDPPAPPANPALPTFRAGRYVSLRVLGGGNTRVVYEAWDRELSVRCAIKTSVGTIDPLAQEAILARHRWESRILSVLRGGGVTLLLDVGEESAGDGLRPFQVLQFVSGQTIEERIVQGGVPAEEVVEVIRSAAVALRGMHSQGVLHLGVRPTHLLLTDARNVILCDIGQAMARVGNTPKPVTHPDPLYLAPELAESTGAGSDQSDVFGLAQVALAMLSGNARPTPPHLRGDPEPQGYLQTPADEPAKAVLLAALHPTPSRRPSSPEVLASELARALRDARRAPASSGAPRGRVVRPRRPREPEPRPPRTLPFVDVPPSLFPMGDDHGAPDEAPRHPTRLTLPYQLGLTPVTQAAWRRITTLGRQRRIPEAGYLETEPSSVVGAEHPVENVSWFDCVRWCNVLSLLRGLDRAYEIEELDGETQVLWFPVRQGFRLPTEAEWERACYGPRGEREAPTGSAECAWHQDNSDGTSHPVGLLAPSPLGFHDLLGNVWEWCWDRYGHDAYQTTHRIDPVGTQDGPERVMRGGAWWTSMENCRPSVRGSSDPRVGSSLQGFRVARTLRG